MPTMASGTAANSLASTPIDATPPARATRSWSAHRITSGDSQKISGSDRYGCQRAWKDPNPDALSTPAIADARTDIPRKRHRSNTAIAAAALQSTAYAFHFTSNGPGSAPIVHGTRTRKQWISAQPGVIIRSDASM